MFNLVYNLDQYPGRYLDLFQSSDGAIIQTNQTLELFTTEDEVRARIIELGLTPIYIRRQDGTNPSGDTDGPTIS